MPINTIVDIKDVSFGYADEPAVSDITLSIHRGEYWGLIGPNGSGKTTLLKIILGLLKPQKGSVALFGQDSRQFHDWSKIGYVPQKAGANVTAFPISVEEVVGMGGANQQTISESLTAVEMLPLRHRLLRELSGGQQQRIFIARALASHPQLLILDEPTVGVDAQSQSKFYHLLHHLNRHQALTLILVSHDLDVVAHEVDKVARINCRLMDH